jgi:uncharacterized protein YjbJ (UPF0337 family)
LDNLCNPSNSLVVGNRKFLHVGRVHTLAARDCSCGVADPLDTGTQASCLTALAQVPPSTDFPQAKVQPAFQKIERKTHGGGAMDKDRVKGTIDDAAGRAKRQIGEWTGDTDAQVKGAAQQVKGKAEKIVGNVKDAVRDAADEAKRHRERNEKLEHEHSVAGSRKS